MRRAHLCAAIGVALALMTPAVAIADIGPVPRPESPAKTVTPLAKPTTQAPAGAPAPQAQPAKQPQPVKQQQPVQRPPTATPTPTPTPTPTYSSPPTPVAVSGGREQPSLTTAVAKPRTHTSLPARIALLPTQLADVGHDSLPSYDTWPSWVLGAFTLLASVEAFLLVRLARARRYRRHAQLELAD